jgi:hypothetical protein
MRRDLRVILIEIETVPWCTVAMKRRATTYLAASHDRHEEECSHNRLYEWRYRTRARS